MADELARALADRASGLVFDAGSITVGGHLDRWLEDSDRGSVRTSTYERHREIVGLHIRPALGRVKLSKLTPAHMQGLYRDKLDSGLSPATVQKLHTVLHKSLAQALKWNRDPPRNVPDAVEAPRPTPKEMHPLSPVEACRLLEASRDHGLVFTSGVGTFINPTNLRRRSFAPLLQRAGLPQRRFHDLRHTCATLLLARNVHPKYVQELLGHATVAITLANYSHLIPGMGSHTARAMEDVFS